MKRRSFSSEFKTKVVLAAICDEKEIIQLAKKHSIAPNLIRNWKTEFLSNASSVFDTKRDFKLLKSFANLKLKKKNSPKRSVNLLCRLIGSIKSEETFGPDWESKFSPRPKGLE